MKPIFLIHLFLLGVFNFSFSQTPGEWTWMHGPQTFQSPVFGTKGIPSPGNIPPAAYEALAFTDLQGNFWCFGGSGGYSDLWKYDPVTNEWTWMNGSGSQFVPPNYGVLGVPDPANTPGYRFFASCSWTDLNGNFWLFGGEFPLGQSNSLWRYDPSTDLWTWISGGNTPNNFGNYGVQGVPSVFNAPPSREENTTAWADQSGNLWLFGGKGYSGEKNDLWKYEIATNEWTWMKGSTGFNTAPVYGSRGISDPANDPGGRSSYGHWLDQNGMLWTFGGGSLTLNEFRNDMWKYDPSLNVWTWMSGGTGVNDSTGHYSLPCINDTANLPGSRFENNMSWIDSCGHFWMYGGSHSTVPASGSPLCDLWKYNPCLNRWTFVKGNAIPSQLPVYGTKGISSPSNTPGGRMGSPFWTDNYGNFWMAFGITAWNPTSNTRNDLWRYVPDYSCGSCFTNPLAAFTASENNICPGTCISFGNLSADATSFEWIFNGASPGSSSDVNPSNICYMFPGQYDVTIIAQACDEVSDTLTLTNYITVYPQPPPQGIQQSGDTLFAIPGASSYQWYFNSNIITGATDYFYAATQSGNYNVVATDGNGCEVEAVINNVIASLSPALSEGEGVTAFPNPVSETLDVRGLNVNSVDEITIYNIIGEKVFSAVDCQLLPIAIGTHFQFPSGMYYLEISSNEKIYRTKFLKQ